MLPQFVGGDISATASEISRVLVGWYMVPCHSFVLADFSHTVGNELAILALSVDPVQRHCGIQPAMYFRHFLEPDRRFNVSYKVRRHMSSNELQPWNRQTLFC